MSTGKIELSVGAVKIADKYEIFTKEEIDAINNKIPELDKRVGDIEGEIEEINNINKKIPELDERVDVIEDDIEEINSSLDNKTNLTNKRVELLNEVNSTKGILELANFAGQGIASNIIAFILHHYTDSGMIQFDNVGDGTILTLKNAHNPSRRPDKGEEYVGKGKYLSLVVHNNEKGYAEEIMFVDRDGDIVYTGVKSTASIGSNKDNDGVYCFEIKCYKENEFIARITNGSKGQILGIKSSATNTRVDIETSDSQLNGMLIKTKKGSLNLTSGVNGNEDMILKGKRIRASTDNGTTTKNVQLTNGGTTSQRPTFTVPFETYFDTDLNKLIIRNANNNGWVDVNGKGV